MFEFAPDLSTPQSDKYELCQQIHKIAPDQTKTWCIINLITTPYYLLVIGKNTQTKPNML